MKISGFAPGVPDERIVRRHGAVVVEAQRLADVIVERLRLHAQAVVSSSGVARVAAEAIAIADRHVEHPVRAEQMRPAMLPLVSHASATKISLTSPSVVPSRWPRATASVVPFGPSFGYET